MRALWTEAVGAETLSGRFLKSKPQLRIRRKGPLGARGLSAQRFKGLSREGVDLYLEVLWEELTDVPFDEDALGQLILAVNWYHFPAGTEREEIWHWFDVRHSKGVAYLMRTKS